MYIKKLKKLNGVEIMETPNHSSNNNWLNLIKVTKNQNVKEIIRKLRLKYINVRPVWLPNHLQKPFRKCQTYKITNCKKYIKNLICIPSSSSLKKNHR